ncbi:hypothetical protein E2C01_001635 [Portunus trituberculatus]|uniref:Uncharacterized protein n=1 Tax=Portunus trituberculatus TaxID=210409 RepID=A0A5B7CMZ9_PORTR|nr:hypothetical protein [Portunus trituberculatus]
MWDGCAPQTKAGPRETIVFGAQQIDLFISWEVLSTSSQTPASHLAPGSVTNRREKATETRCSVIASTLSEEI